jgi:GLPGLI family protein
MSNLLKNTSLALLLFISLSFVKKNPNYGKSEFVKVTYVSERILTQAQLDQIPAAFIDALKKPKINILETSAVNSIFYPLEKDQMLSNEKDVTGAKTKQSKVTLKAGGSTFKDFETGLLYSSSTLNKIDYLIKSVVNNREWKILAEKAEIAGIQCQKATTEYNGVTTEAWFALDIPIPDGPGIYNGLPGLILKIESPLIKQYATKIEFPKEVSIIKPSGKIITKEEYDQLLKEANSEKEINEGGTSTKTTSKVIRVN